MIAYKVSIMPSLVNHVSPSLTGIMRHMAATEEQVAKLQKRIV